MHSCCFQKKRISNKALIGLRFIFSGYSSDRSLQDVSVQALRQKRRVKGLTLTHPGHMGIVSIVVKWPQQSSQYDASDDKRARCPHSGNSTFGQLPCGKSTMQQPRRISATEVCRDADGRIQKLAGKHARWPGGHESACGTVPGAESMRVQFGACWLV